MVSHSSMCNSRYSPRVIGADLVFLVFISFSAPSGSSRSHILVVKLWIVLYFLVSLHGLGMLGSLPVLVNG